MNFEVKSSPDAIARYRKLLLEDRSIATLRHALALVERVVGRSFVVSVGDDDDEDEAPQTGAEYPISEALQGEYRERLEQLNNQLKKEQQTRRARPRIDPADRAQVELTWRTIVVLTLPYNPNLGPPVELSGDIAFLDDIRSVVFETAADELLPLLSGAKWTAMARTLVNALWFHIQWSSPSHAPAHQHYLRSVFFEAIGDHEHAGAELLNAARATAPTDPDYFVKVYTYWSFLVDHRRVKEAKAFALAVHRECPEAHRSAAEQLVDSSYDLLLQQKVSGKSRRA